MGRFIAGLMTMFCVLGLSVKAHAMAGDLKSPSVAFPEDISGAWRAFMFKYPQIAGVLRWGREHRV